MNLSASSAEPLVPSWGSMGFILIPSAVLFIAALVSIARDKTHTYGGTVFWVVLVLVLPFLGPVLWFLIGRKGTFRSHLGDQAR